MAKKVQLALIGSRPRALKRAIVTVFASKIQLLSKKSAAKFLCVKTSSGKVVATSFLWRGYGHVTVLKFCRLL